MITDNQYSKAWRKSSTHFDKVLDEKNINNIDAVTNSNFLDLMKDHRKWCDTR